MVRTELLANGEKDSRDNLSKVTSIGKNLGPSLGWKVCASISGLSAYTPVHIIAATIRRVRENRAMAWMEGNEPVACFVD